MKKRYCILLILLITTYAQAQTLERKAWFGVISSEKDNRVRIDSVGINSTAEKLGLKKKDILLSINHQPIQSNTEFLSIASELRANDHLVVQFQRNGIQQNAETVSISKPLFKADWCDVVYQSLPAIGCTVRTIMYKPKGKSATPGIFFIPGYNCGSIESYPFNYNGKMIEQWVKKGYAVYTVEKSGVGDSYGCKPCLEVDLQTDIDLYETAYKEFSELPFLDKKNLFIWGHSMGGIIAPIIAQGKSVKGVMVFGTVFRPWSEFLLEMHRVQKPLTDSMTYEQTEDFVRMIQRIYYEFFVLKKSPAQLVENSAYKKIVESELEYKPGKEDMWGRHWRFWQQLDSINLAKEWQHLDCKVLVLQGSADFIQCSSLEPYLIVEAVNQLHPGNATSITLPELDHLIMNSKNFPDAVRNMNNKEYNKGNFNAKLAEETLKWMDMQVACCN